MDKTSKKRELVGELFILSKMPIVGIFPIIINYVTKLMPPLLFAGASAIVAGLSVFLYLLFTKQLMRPVSRKALGYILGITVFIIIIPSIFIFIGTSMTSSINTTILLQTELLFTFLICGIFYREPITAQKLIGGFFILGGATAVLFNGSFSLNWGDILIILGTAFYPIGNIFAKKALALTGSAFIILLRSIIGGVFLMVLSLVFEKYNMPLTTYVRENFIYILLNGVAIYCVAKLLFYEGLKRIDISRTIAIGIATPAVSLLYAFLFLKEMPDAYQILGLAVILAGLFVITRKKTEAVTEIT